MRVVIVKCCFFFNADFLAFPSSDKNQNGSRQLQGVDRCHIPYSNEFIGSWCLSWRTKEYG